MKPERRWRQTVRAGLLWGLGAAFISLVGLVEALQQRQIITGLVSGGHTLLAVTGLVVGLSAGRRHAGEGLARRLAAGGFGGVLAGGMVALLVVAGSLVNLRAMIVGATPGLFELLTFGRGTAAAPWIVLGAAILAACGAVLTTLPRRVLSVTTTALVAVLGVGLLQEQVQLLLQAERIARFREIVFTFDGLTPIGAVIVGVAAAVVSALVQWQRPLVQRRVGAMAHGPRRTLRVILIVLGLAALFALPLFVGAFFSQVLILVGLYTLMGLGLNLEVGFAGLLDLGFAAFFAIGAYTVGLLTSTSDLGIANLSWWSAMLIAVGVSLLAGVFFGLPVLRIRGDYLAVATLGFGEIIRLLVLSDYLRPWLGGSQGLLSIPKPVLGDFFISSLYVPKLFEFRGPEQLFFITVAASAVVAFIAARLRDSRLGRAWMAMREDEDVAEAMGINLVNVKLLAYGIGAAFAGVSGAIFAVMVGSIFPHSFTVLVSINVLALIIVGGMGSLPGVAVGSLFLVGLPELLREFSDYRFLVYGAALMAMMILRPEGLWPAPAQRRELREEVARIPEGELVEAAGGET